MPSRLSKLQRRVQRLERLVLSATPKQAPSWRCRHGTDHQIAVQLSPCGCVYRPGASWCCQRCGVLFNGMAPRGEYALALCEPCVAAMNNPSGKHTWSKLLEIPNPEARAAILAARAVLASKLLASLLRVEPCSQNIQEIYARAREVDHVLKGGRDEQLEQFDQFDGG